MTTERAVRERLAKNLRGLAKRKKIALTRLADSAALSRSSLWQILRAESAATIDTMTRLAEALEVDVQELLAR